MIKSKKVWRRIISIFGIIAVFAFVSILLSLHIFFPTKYSDSIASAAQKYDVDANLVRAVIWTESKYKKDAESSRGALGLMQLLPTTAEYIAKNAGIDDFSKEMLYDEETNITLGVCYLRYLLDRFGDETTAITAYNAGEGNVVRWRNEGLDSIPFEETKEYVQRVRFVKKIYHFKSR